VRSTREVGEVSSKLPFAFALALNLPEDRFVDKVKRGPN
jgi:hypothetical protein